MEIKGKTIFILVLFVILVWIGSGFIIYNSFSEPEERGTFGDMFGFINALFSGLALLGIVLSIYIQQKELDLQRQELADTREEFKTNRITNILFKQVEYLNNSIDKLKFKENQPLVNYTLFDLNNKLENYLTKNNDNSYFSLLEKNSNSIIYLTSKIFPIIKNFEKLLTKSNLNDKETQSLKDLFSSNINQSLFEVYVLYFKDWIDNEYKEIDRMGDEEIKAIEYEFINKLKDKINYILSYNVMDE